MGRAAGAGPAFSDPVLSCPSLVIDTLKEVDETRKCFRMVGGVLVERTVKEVLPALENNKEQVSESRRALGNHGRGKRRAGIEGIGAGSLSSLLASALHATLGPTHRREAVCLCSWLIWGGEVVRAVFPWIPASISAGGLI